MKYFMKRENVNQYKEMLEGYDPMPVIEKLEMHVEAGSAILELGMGAGLDYSILSKKYQVLGTDNSPLFIEDYKREFPDANVMILDATDITLQKKFDCIFSNKVLQHLTRENFLKSLKQQKMILNPNGILFMTLWHGKHKEELMFDGELLFTYYTEEDIRKICKPFFKKIHIERYTEMDTDDSLIVVLKL